MKKVLVERIIDFSEESAAELDFEQIEQRIATVSVENSDTASPDRIIDRAYNEANLRTKDGKHRLTALGKEIVLDE